MPKKNDTLKKLIRELEQGKKKLRLDYNRGIRAIDDAIAILEKLNLEPAEIVKSVHRGSVGRPKADEVNVVKLVEKRAGRRGRLPLLPGSKQLSLTRLIFDAVVAKKRYVHQRDVVQHVLKKHEAEDSPEFAKKISVLLAALKKQNKLVTVNLGGYRRNIVWGLPEWLGADGKINKGFEPKQEKGRK